MRCYGERLSSGGYDSAGLEPDHTLLQVVTVTYWKQLSHHLFEYNHD